MGIIHFKTFVQNFGYSKGSRGFVGQELNTGSKPK